MNISPRTAIMLSLMAIAGLAMIANGVPDGTSRNDARKYVPWTPPDWNAPSDPPPSKGIQK